MVPSWCVATGLLTGIILFSETVFSTVQGPIISIKSGTFEGLELTVPGEKRSIHAFLGIPYAEPPTGAQRFCKPKPIKFIEGTYKATEKPPSCFQLESDLHFPWGDNSSVMTEDCLYLNIWAPERRTTEENLRPVMVWLHGGGCVVGSSAMDLYDGQVMSSLGDVVIVTINYRLGALGFLNALADDAPGNIALYDQLLALHWVQDNIEYFGGDPKRVTLFGESAGAMCASYVALSPLSCGLFHRMIIQSGSSYALNMQSPSQNVEVGNQLAVIVGCANSTFTLSSHPKEVVDCLRSLPATELMKSRYKLHNFIQKKINLPFRPQFHDEVIPKHPTAMFLSKNYAANDVFAGVTQVEGSALFSSFFPEVYQQYIDGELVMNKTVAAGLLKGFFKMIRLTQPEKPANFYLQDINDDDYDQQRIVTATYEAIGDFLIFCPTIFTAEKYSERGAHVQFYRFDHRPSTSLWPEWMGTAHFEEVQFVFGMPIRYPESYRSEERELSEFMIRTWTDFAKSEGLTLKNGLKWPNFSRSDPVYATLDTNRQTTGRGLRMNQCEFWRPYFNAE